MPVTSLSEAEQRLLDVLREPPTIAERLCQAIATPRSLMLGAALGPLWLLGNRALAFWSGVDLDPFPFRWLQRVLIGSAVAMAMIAARANGDRCRRAERLLSAQRALAEAARWGRASRTLQILGRARTSISPK